MYSEFLRGVEHELMLCLPAGPGRTVRLLFFRGPGPDFSERDRALLALLRPHLREAYLDAERRRRGVPDLTPPALGTAAAGGGRCHERANRPQARHLGGNRAHTHGEHLPAIAR